MDEVGEECTSAASCCFTAETGVIASPLIDDYVGGLITVEKQSVLF
jgi:hypothetical protein